ncbi:MAG: two-component system response regulator [Ilumatobacteraceae bacterium]|nr:two-component system response regulator [Ilumatobacteraceae bacterium]
MTDAGDAASAGHILVVEDDATIGTSVRDALLAAGFQVTLRDRGAEVPALIETTSVDLVLLDAGLPDTDGFALCRRLRTAHAALPIVLVTARDAEIDIVVGLDSGANDYVTKPFSMSILLARVRAQLRGSIDRDPAAPILLGELSIDASAYTVSAAGSPVSLRPREFELLLYLAREAGRVVTRERLLADVWDVHWDTSTKTLDMHILSIRRKLGSSVEIVTVRGVGYRIDIP